MATEEEKKAAAEAKAAEEKAAKEAKEKADLEAKAQEEADAKAAKEAAEAKAAEEAKKAEEADAAAKAKEEADAKEKAAAEAKAAAAKAKGAKSLGGARRQSNPNKPPTEAEKRAKLQDLDADLGGGEYRKSLPDDAEALKDLLAQAKNDELKANAEIAELNHLANQNQHKVEGYDKLHKQLGNELKQTTELFRPVLGLQVADKGVEMLAAPVGGEGNRRSLAIFLAFQNGELSQILMTAVEIAMHDDHAGRWKVK